MTSPGLAQAAQMLVQSALRLRPGERLVLVEDAISVPIADAIASEAESGGAWVKRARLDRMASAGGSGRPHKIVPDLLLFALHESDCAVFVAAALPGEATMRQAMLHVVRQRRIRHAHAPGIGIEAFTAGLRIDGRHLQRLGERVLGRLRGSRVIVTESPAGTSLRVELAPEGRWFAQLGVIEPGAVANLPAGAIYASPVGASGVFVADASLGEFFGAREGLLRANPLRLIVDDGRVVGVETRSPRLRDDVEAMLHVAPNSDRIGLVAVGVNIGLDGPLGDAQVDQNLPGLHVGIGDPAARSTGATWSAPTCFAGCQAMSRVVVDGEVIVDAGRVVLPSRRTQQAARVSTPAPPGG